METDSPTPVADGGGEGIGGWVQQWRDPEMIIWVSDLKRQLLCVLRKQVAYV